MQVLGDSCCEGLQAAVPRWASGTWRFQRSALAVKDILYGLAHQQREERVHLHVELKASRGALGPLGGKLCLVRKKSWRKMYLRGRNGIRGHINLGARERATIEPKPVIGGACRGRIELATADANENKIQTTKHMPNRVPPDQALVSPRHDPYTNRHDVRGSTAVG